MKGEGNQQDYGMRVYDPRIAKFLSVDPLTKQYPHYTPYSYAGNKPIAFIDRDGEEEGIDNTLRRKEEAYLSNQLSEDEYREQVRAMGTNGVIGTAIVVDVFLTKGKISQFLLYSQLAGALNHNRAKTKEGREEQERESRTAITGVILTWGTMRLLTEAKETVNLVFTETSSAIYSRLGSLKNPARAILPGEDIPLVNGKQSNALYSGRFSNTVTGEYGDASKKYIWTIDDKGINIGLEQTPIGANTVIKHTNLSPQAYAGGEAWFIDERTVHINAWSGRFGAGAKMTAEEWKASVDSWKSLGYKVIVEPYKPPK